MADLWDEHRRKNLQGAQPLAVRMRPRNLEDFVGQEHFLGRGKMLRRMLMADRLTSVIFYGPPGTGKTTLASVIAAHTKRYFERANAAAVGVKEIRSVLDRARQSLANDGVRTIFFLDEIHRFNRAQQDVLLEDVERGIVTLIGATTENPFFAINSPLVSRSQIFRFEPLTEDEIRLVLCRAINDPKQGYGEWSIHIEDDAINHWARMSDGDARRALSALEIAVLSGGADNGNEAAALDKIARPPQVNGKAPMSEDNGDPSTIVIDSHAAQQSIQRKAIVYDGVGDEHYDAISALIKSMRGQ